MGSFLNTLGRVSLGVATGGLSEISDGIGLTNIYGGNGRSSPSYNPDEANAQLFREDYQRYQDTYQPLEDRLFQRYATWGQDTRGAQSSAISTSNRYFEQAEGQDARQMKSYGIQPNQEERASMRRQYDVAAATSAINAANTVGREMDDAKYGLMGGMSPYRQGG